MPVPTYNVIADSEIDSESPITSSLMTRLRDNVCALLGVDPASSTPSPQLGGGPKGQALYQTPGTYYLTVPLGSSVRCWLVGAGGGGSSVGTSGTGGTGGNSYVDDGTNHVEATGGAGGQSINISSSGVGGAGGTGSGGTGFNVNGQAGTYAYGNAGKNLAGGMSGSGVSVPLRVHPSAADVPPSDAFGTYPGNGGGSGTGLTGFNGTGASGGGGGVRVASFTAASTTLMIVVGSGGAGSGVGNGGAHGYIMVEY